MRFNIFYAPEDDGQGADFSNEGPQEEESAAQDQGFSSNDGGQPEHTEESFFEIQDEKGNPVKFKSKEELAEAWKRSGMLRSDYTRKTQSLAEERKQLEQWKQQEEQGIQERKQEMQKFNDFLKKRPDIYQELKKRMNSPDHNTAFHQAKQYADEQTQSVKKELNELKEWKQQREAEEQRKQVFDKMKTQYGDFDESKVHDLLGNIDPNDPEKLVELLYYASKGQESPAQIEQRMAEQQKKKQQGRMVPGNGTPTPSKGSYRTFDEAEAAALKDL